MKDNFGREIKYLRISVTDLCNLRCKYCMPESGIDKKPHFNILSFEEIYQIAKASVELGIDKIRITGGEPLVRKDIVTLVEKLASIDGIKDLAMTTNGILLKDYATDLKKAGLNRVNISLDTLYEDRYTDITRGGNIYDVMDGLEGAIVAGLTPVKINTVIIKGFNDDEIMNFVQLTLNEPLYIRFIELMPIGQVGTSGKYEFVSNEEILSKLQGIKPVKMEDGAVAKYYQFPGALGKIGFINPISDHFCSDCNKIRLTSDGKLKPCLHSNEEIDLKEVLDKNDFGLLKETIKQTILNKPERHYLKENPEIVSREMNKIGG